MKKLLTAAAGVYLVCGVVGAQTDQHGRTPDEGAPPGAHMRHQPGRPMPMPDNRTDRGTLGDRMHRNPGFQQEPHLPNGTDLMHRSATGVHPDFDRFRGSAQATRRFHAGEWHAPQGFHYHRWSYGQRLPAPYFMRGYWIGPYGTYGLMAPPPGAVWVRYGPDALLVDRFTGEIIRVEYGIFY